MADEEKLKHLEKALAQELDQHVKLGESSDPRFDGSVQVNPELNTAMAPTIEVQSVSNQGPGNVQVIARSITDAALGGTLPPDTTGTVQKVSGGQTEELSLAAIDGLLADFDVGFKSTMDGISEGIKIASDEISLTDSIAIGTDYLPDEPDQMKAAGPAAVKQAPVEKSKVQLPDLSITVTLLKLMKETVLFIPHILRGLPHEIEHARSVGLKQELKDFIVTIKVPWELWKVALNDVVRAIQSAWKFFVATPLRMKLRVLAILLLAGLTYWLIQHVIERVRYEKEADVSLGNVAEVADSMHPLKEEDEGQELNSPIKHPEYVVLIQPIVASLKAPQVSKNPMGRVELYIEASNQDTATEIKDRELEVRDLIERVLEQSTFDELESSAGKLRFKIHARKEMNKLLNRGSAVRIFFKTFVIHPGL